eukprot:367526_1
MGTTVLRSKKNQIIETLDSTIFKNQSRKCEKVKSNVINHCQSLQRLFVGLKYYNTLCASNKSNQTQVTKQLLVQFCKETYTMLLDDLSHFSQEHSDVDQLTQIGDELQSQRGFVQCNISKCHKLDRHYQSRATYKNIKNSKYYDTDNNAIFDFYTDCFDNIHHRLFHVFKIGLKIESTATFSDSKSQNVNDNVVSFNCIDNVFEKKRNQIFNRRKQCGLDFHRYTDQHNKYNICIDNKSPSESITTTTYLEAMYEYIQRKQGKHVLKTQLTHLNDFIVDEEYDSDAVQYDLDDCIQPEHNATKPQSNIYQRIKHERFINLIIGYITTTKLSVSLFSTGFSFYYWSYYKNKVTNQKENWDEWNKYRVND